MPCEDSREPPGPSWSCNSLTELYRLIGLGLELICSARTENDKAAWVEFTNSLLMDLSGLTGQLYEWEEFLADWQEAEFAGRLS